MPKLYHSIPLDEEQSHELREKRVWTSKLDRDALTTAVSEWAWLVHAILLSISMTLFALSFCRTGTSTHAPQLSDDELLNRVSTYCMLSSFATREKDTILLTSRSSCVPGCQVRLKEVHIRTDHELKVRWIWSRG